MGLGPAAAFLAEVVEPPPAKAVAAAVATLVEVGALTVRGSPLAGGGVGAAGSAAEGDGGTAAGAAAGVEYEEALTPLGRHLAALPLDPRLGKLLVMGACLGCLSPALVRAVFGFFWFLSFFCASGKTRVMWACCC